jgi:hypothetical protein
VDIGDILDGNLNIEIPPVAKKPEALKRSLGAAHTIA